MYYFTFGSSPDFPFQDGWVTVDADTRTEACEIFRQYYPNSKHPDTINCSFIYPEEQFKHTSMYKEGNFNAFCHNHLTKEPTPKMDISHLIIETTRKCNMACEHCLRGDAQNKNITMETLIPFLKHVNEIGTLSFSGGEPTLHLDILEQLLEYVKEHQIPVYNFYIVTNGKTVSDRFLYLLINWYVYTINYTYEPEMSGVALSKDPFHEEIPTENIQKLRALSFFRTDKFNDFKGKSLIPKGKARNLPAEKFINRSSTTEFSDYIEYEPEENLFRFSDNDIYITVNGNIILDCDYEYEEEEKITKGNTRKMHDFFRLVKEHANKEGE